jgi:hypothetical protein
VSRSGFVRAYAGKTVLRPKRHLAQHARDGETYRKGQAGRSGHG